MEKIFPEITRVEILKAARDLVAAGWCQGAAARDQQGRSTFTVDPSARQFCLTGAIHRAVHTLSHGHPISILHGHIECALLDQRVDCQPCVFDIRPIALWNDQPGRTQAEAVAFLEDAIADLK